MLALWLTLPLFESFVVHLVSQTGAGFSAHRHDQWEGQADKPNSSFGICTTSYLQNTRHRRCLRAEANLALVSNAGEGEVCWPHPAMGSAPGEGRLLGCRNVLSQVASGKRPAKEGLPGLGKPQCSEAWCGNKGQWAGGDAHESSTLQGQICTRRSTICIMVMDGSRWWWMVFSSICSSRWAGSSLQWSWGMVTLLLMQRSELALRSGIPRSPPPCLICMLEVSLKPRGALDFLLGCPGTARGGSLALAGSCTVEKLWAGFITANSWTSWWGEGRVHGGRFGSSRGYRSHSSQGPFGFGSRGSLMWAGLAALTSPKSPMPKHPLWPKLPLAMDVQTDSGHRSWWR